MRFKVNTLGDSSHTYEMEMTDDEFYAVKKFLKEFSDVSHIASYYDIEVETDEMGCPMTDWNTIITKFNKKVISLDDDKEKQFKFIMYARSYLDIVKHFSPEKVNGWFKSQCIITGHDEESISFDFIEIYRTATNYIEDYFSKTFNETWGEL